MQAPDPGTAQSLKQRALAEFKAYWVVTRYLWLFLGCFTVYRRLVLAETGVPCLHYGVALVEAMVIAKVVLIGRVFGLTLRIDDAPLIAPVAYKTALFALLVLLFRVVERLATGSIHKQGLLAVLREIADTGAHEFGARAVMPTVAFVPFYAFSEVSRVMGRNGSQQCFCRGRLRRPVPTQSPPQMRSDCFGRMPAASVLPANTPSTQATGMHP